MEIDIRPDDTEVLLDEGFCTAGGGGGGIRAFWEHVPCCDMNLY